MRTAPRPPPAPTVPTRRHTTHPARGSATRPRALPAAAAALLADALLLVPPPSSDAVHRLVAHPVDGDVAALLDDVSARTVLDFLLHHPVAAAAAALTATVAVPRLARAVWRRLVVPLAVVAVLAVVAASPSTAVGALNGALGFASAHPVATSAVILATAALALSPYLLLAALIGLLAFGVPRLPPALRPALPEPAVEAAAAAAAASDAVRRWGAAAADAVADAVGTPARRVTGAAERAGAAVAGTARAARDAVAAPLAEATRCRGRPTSRERAACVREQSEALDRAAAAKFRGGG